METSREWFADKAPTYAAALSYHMLLALAPLVIIAVGVLSALFQSTTSSDEIVQQAEDHLGAPAADAVQFVLDSVHQHPSAGVAAMVIGGIFLLVAAASAFRALRKALNATWNVEPIPLGKNPHNFLVMVLNQAFLLLLVLLVALFIAALTALSTLWGSLSKLLTDSMPSPQALLTLTDFLFSWGLTTALFAALFSAVPLARLPQRYIWRSAVLTAFLFSLGKLGFGVYMSYSGTASLYGAAGSLVVFLIWVYYSAMIMFFGAEWAQMLARHHGVEVEPRRGARRTISPGD
jgi:membrane protein